MHKWSSLCSHRKQQSRMGGTPAKAHGKQGQSHLSISEFIGVSSLLIETYALSTFFLGCGMVSDDELELVPLFKPDLLAKSLSNSA